MVWEQLTLPDSLPAGYLPASNPDLVEGYISIKEIMQGPSVDFHECFRCGKTWCEHQLNGKREDDSYQILVKHFRNGGKINVPVFRWTDLYDGTGEQSNGHHRIIAAMDAGFTHVPYQTQKKGEGWRDDWSGTPDYDDLRFSDSE